MDSTTSVLSSLGAIGTLLENFPMGILDNDRGKVYTSVFDFLIDVLVACKVDVNEIMEYLLREIYGVESSIAGGIDNLYKQIANGQIAIDTQNAFMQGLEESIKGILMGLLTSIFTCSAIPVIPNKLFDGPKSEYFRNHVNGVLLQMLQSPQNPFPQVIIPRSVIDPLNLLSICPTSSDGKLYYSVDATDKYYHKEYVRRTEYITSSITVPQNTSAVQVTYTEELIYPDDKQVKLYIETELEGDEYSEDINVFKLSKALSRRINITVNYSPYGSKDSLTWNGTIESNTTESDTWLSSPTDMVGTGQKTVINYILINNSDVGVDVDGSWVYLDRDMSQNFINRWVSNGATSINSITWGSQNTTTETVRHEEVVTGETEKVIETQISATTKVLSYVSITVDDLADNIPERVNYVPDDESITSGSPEYIVCYGGLNPNLLYRSMDMNAFLWYVLNNGKKNPQEEYNHMMWDSRVPAAKAGKGRMTDEDWNTWYASKPSYTDEFQYEDAPIKEDSPIYPIIQLESQGTTKSLFRVHLPSQRYFYPSYRTSVIEGTEAPGLALNSTLYKFDWDYLQSIQILHPKLMLARLCEHLLGFSLSTIANTNISFTKKLIEEKLSSAIVSVIEANDMEVEDCYTSFSNDDVNAMLEDMLLSRYSATYYGGETSPARQHDIQSYRAMLDAVNTGATTEGTVTTITRLITEVSSDPGTEGSINYGLQVSTDGNILQKLLWAIAMPIMESIFTPQVMLLIVLNFEMMGLTRMDEFLNNDYGAILNLLLNKILALAKSIVLYIKDKIVELLLTFFYQRVMPLLMEYKIILNLEKLNYWLTLLAAAIACLPTFRFSRRSIIASIDDVNYVDIISEQNTPEASSTC